jgi:hypothetical protein
MAFKFEQLKVWQKALELSENINELAKEFPRDEIYVLSTQIKRAADSVALNIAEGSTGQTNADFKRFLSYEKLSVMTIFRNVMPNSKQSSKCCRRSEILLNEAVEG